MEKPPSWIDRAKKRIRKLVSREALPPWILAAPSLGEWIMDLIGWAGDIQFLVSAWSTVGPLARYAFALLGDWGWLPATLWLGYLVVRPDNASEAVEGVETHTQIPEEATGARDRHSLTPTPIQQQALDDLRSLFHSTAKNSWRSAYRLLGETRKILQDTNPLAPLLLTIESESKDARDAVEQHLKNPETTNFREATDAFAHFFQMYMRTVRWLHCAAGDSDFKSKVSSYEPYWNWESQHEAFQREAGRVLNRAPLTDLKQQILEVGWGKRYFDDLGKGLPGRSAIIETLRRYHKEGAELASETRKRDDDFELQREFVDWGRMVSDYLDEHVGNHARDAFGRFTPSKTTTLNMEELRSRIEGKLESLQLIITELSES